MNNLPIPQSRSEELMNAFIQRDSSQISTPQSRIEEFWYHLIEGTNSLPIPQSRNELLLKKIIENDTHQIPLAQSRTEEFLVSILTGDINKLPIPQSRSEYYLDYIARNNLLLNDIDYVRYSGTNITATNTVQKPFRSAILMGNTDYKSVDWITNFHYQHGLELTNGKVGYIKRDVRCSTCVDINENRRFILKASSNIDISIVTADENNNVIKDYLWFVTTADETRFTVEDNCKFLYLNFRKKDLSAFTSESEVINSGLTVKEQNLVSVKMPVLSTSNLIYHFGKGGRI